MKYLIPESLETERLHLRMFREEDWNDIHEFYSDAECIKYTTRKVLNENESRQKLETLMAHWPLHKYGSYALEEKKLKKVIGFAGLDYPNDWPEPEIQWCLVRAYWGKGYASEAVKGIKKILSEFLPGMTPISLIHPQNTNSINLAKSLGAVYEKDYVLRGHTYHIYRHVD